MDFKGQVRRIKKKIRKSDKSETQFDKLKKEALKVLQKIESEHNIEDDIAESIAIVEYYYGVVITNKSPIMKRFNQMEHLQKIFELDTKRFGLK